MCLSPVACHASLIKENDHVKSVALTGEGLSFSILANIGFDCAVVVNIQLKRDLETCFTYL